MKKLFSMTLLLMVSLITSAQENEQGSQNEQGTQNEQGSNAAPEVVVITNDKYDNGTVEVLKKDGQKVIITVTPSDGYYIEKGDVEVIPVKDPATTRTEDSETSVPTGSALTLTLVDKDGKAVVNDKGETLADAADLTKARYYQFTVPEGLGAWISKADFHKIGTDGKLSETVTWKISESKEGETTTVTLTIDGEGAASIKEDAAAPWDVQKTKITNVVLGAKITSIGKDLFKDCTALVSVVIKNDAAIVTLGENAIPANKGLKIDVPGNLYNMYKITTGWKDLTIDSKNAVKMEGVKFVKDKNKYDVFAAKQDLVVPFGVKAFDVDGIQSNTILLKEVKTLTKDMPVLLFSENIQTEDLRTAAGPQPQKTRADEGAATSTAKCALKVVPDNEETQKIKGLEVKLGQVYLLYNDVFYLSQAGIIPIGGIYLEITKEEQKSGTRSALTIGGGDGTTAIDAERLIDNGQLIMDNSCWYDLSGRRLNAKPTAKGLYIVNGRKVVIK